MRHKRHDLRLWPLRRGLTTHSDITHAPTSWEQQPPSHYIVDIQIRIRRISPYAWGCWDRPNWSVICYSHVLRSLAARSQYVVCVQTPTAVRRIGETSACRQVPTPAVHSRRCSGLEFAPLLHPLVAHCLRAAQAGVGYATPRSGPPCRGRRPLPRSARGSRQFPHSVRRFPRRSAAGHRSCRLPAMAESRWTRPAHPTRTAPLRVPPSNPITGTDRVGRSILGRWRDHPVRPPTNSVRRCTTHTCTGAVVPAAPDWRPAHQRHESGRAVPRGRSPVAGAGPPNRTASPPGVGSTP